MNGRRLADFSLRPLFKVAGLSLGTIGLVLGGVSLVRGDRAAMGLVVLSIAGIAGGLLLPWRGPEPLRRALAGELTERVALSQQTPGNLEGCRPRGGSRLHAERAGRLGLPGRDVVQEDRLVHPPEQRDANRAVGRADLGRRGRLRGLDRRRAVAPPVVAGAARRRRSGGRRGRVVTLGYRATASGEGHPA